MKWNQLRLSIILLVLAALPVALMVAKAQEATEEATEEAAMTEEEALVERGHYLIYMAGCISCHTPNKEEYADYSALSLEQAIDLSLFALTTLDVENRQLAGGRPFDLGPMGVILSRNLTPDETTGLGAWTDEEIEAAVRIGVSRDGYRLFDRPDVQTDLPFGTVGNDEALCERRESRERRRQLVAGWRKAHELESARCIRPNRICGLPRGVGEDDSCLRKHTIGSVEHSAGERVEGGLCPHA